MSAATLLPKLKRFRRLLGANANRAYWGPDATLSAWPCAVTGAVATAGGSGTTLAAGPGGIMCPVFNGSGRFDATIPNTPQPYAMVAIARSTSTAVSAQYIARTAATNTLWLYLVSSSALLRMAAPTVNNVGTFSQNTDYVVRAHYNGASSQAYINEVLTGSPNVGTNSSGTDLSIGNSWVGAIALWAFVYGTNYAARAAAIASGARTLIGV